jgi:hypothetical protein
MRVICINANPMIGKNGQSCWGGGLVEGKTYTALETVNDEVGVCYRIKELLRNSLGCIKLAERFVPIDDEWVDTLLANIEVEEEELELV